MARPLRIEYKGAYYHIIQRGNEKSTIFRLQNDKEKFLKYLEELNIRYRIIIHSYCLMDNHYHLLIETPEANLTKSMHTLNTSYTIYFNKMHKRSGHLFQGRYNGILVQPNEYLHHLSRYIHLNPVGANLVKDPIEYMWSSYRFFISKNTISPTWLKTDFILGCFNEDEQKARELYKKFVLEGIGQQFSKIKEKVEKEIGDKNFARKLGIYLIRKHTDKKLKDIANIFGKIGDTGISQIYIRIEKEREKDKNLDKMIRRIEELVWNVET